MERKIGEIFNFLDKKLKCVESKNKYCFDCYLFDISYCNTYIFLIGECRKKNRSDKNNIHFELINK